MTSTKMSFPLMALMSLMVMTCAKPSRPGDKIHFQDSAEELDVDQRSGTQQRERNHTGRSPLQQFEQGIPGLYPMRGPAQAPLILPSKNYSDTTNTLVFATQPKVNTPVPQQQPPKVYHYAGNPFLSRYVSESATPTAPNKFNPPTFSGVTNQLPSSDKPAATTINPRRTDLLHGSNLTEDGGSRDNAEATSTTDVSFPDRGIFDTAPHCKPNEILVNNKCRPKV